MDAVSSHSALFFTMGMSAYLGVLHAWLWRRTDPAHLWVAGWCLLAVGYQASRWVQFQAEEPQVAVAAARTTLAVAPLLVASLVCFARTLEERPVAPFAAGVLGAASVLALLSLATPLMVPGRVDPRIDWFGRPYLGAPVSGFALVLVPAIAAAVVYVLRVLLRTPRLHGRERGVLLACLGVYAAMGLASILS
ncbi:MAG: hypothetical protein R3263_10180, partial [Myxococcota bacterium]|nr:hypothetical protein [Myxococcota bacterium]